jgi:hypothetical protein
LSNWKPPSSFLHLTLQCETSCFGNGLYGKTQTFIKLVTSLYADEFKRSLIDLGNTNQPTLSELKINQNSKRN